MRVAEEARKEAEEAKLEAVIAKREAKEAGREVEEAKRGLVEARMEAEEARKEADRLTNRLSAASNKQQIVYHSLLDYSNRVVDDDANYNDHDDALCGGQVDQLGGQVDLLGIEGSPTSERGREVSVTCCDGAGGWRDVVEDDEGIKDSTFPWGSREGSGGGAADDEFRECRIDHGSLKRMKQLVAELDRKKRAGKEKDQVRGRRRGN
jgi:hypothetical protein